ncbi:MAG: hypothetical protein Q8R95_09385, partial [Azonexus sp.]|nr:hypothetical protein [Azonexus sp.]
LQKAAPVGVHGGSSRGLGYYIARFNALVQHGQDLLVADEFPCAFSINYFPWYFCLLLLPQVVFGGGQASR